MGAQSSSPRAHAVAAGAEEPFSWRLLPGMSNAPSSSGFLPNETDALGHPRYEFRLVPPQVA